MEPAVTADVLHRQLFPCLVAGDGLVLGAVVAEHPLDVLHVAHQSQVADEDGDFQHAFQQSPYPVQGQHLAQQAHNGGGQHHEQHQGQHAPQHRRQTHDKVLGLFSQMLIDPFVQLALLGLKGLLPHADLGGVHQAPVAHDQALDHAQHTPHQGNLLPGKGGDGVQLGLDAAIRPAHRGADLTGSPHHDALDESLSPHRGFEFFFFHGISSRPPTRAGRCFLIVSHGPALQTP